MTALPKTVLQAWENRQGPAIFATVDEQGLPNIIYVTCLGIHGNDCLVVADNYFQKTRRNLLAGCRGSILFMDKDGKTYQVKGTLEYLTSGKFFEEMKSWNPPQHPGHGAAALRVEQIFSGPEQIA